MQLGVRQVVVLGGGSAGWMTAALLAAEHAELQLTLIEAPGLPPIGVGEGTWPSMRDTLRRIGVSESELIRRCDVSFKQGSRFDGWRGCDAAFDSYCHPFILPEGFGDHDLAGAWLGQGEGMPFAERVSPQPSLCAQSRAPKQFTTPEFASVLNYGYHLDAGKFGLFLREHAVNRLGVRHIADEVVQVLAAENGDITAVQTRANGAVAGDLFIDCSGTASVLLGGYFEVPLVSAKQALFNDRALAVQLPYPEPEAAIASQTVATAHAKGWSWDIGLPSRRGLGMVYSAAHCSDEEAADCLVAHLVRGGASPQSLSQTALRHLRFEPGYRAKFWVRNCVAVGLSAGFIEPLEASALALVEMSASMLSDEMPRTRACMDLVAQRFNETFSYRWARVIDFLKLHYLMSERQDSAYWLDHRSEASVPERLRELLQLWQFRAPYRHDLPQVEEVFPAASYQYVLYGMGFRPQTPWPQRRSTGPGSAQACFDAVRHKARRLSQALPSNRDLLRHILQHDLPLH